MIESVQPEATGHTIETAPQRDNELNMLLHTEAETRPTLAAAPDIAATNAGGIRDITAATYQWFVYCCKSLEQYTGDCAIFDIDPQTIYNWHALKVMSASPTTANSYLRGIRTVFGRMMKKSLLLHNPALHIPYAPEPPSAPKAIRHETYERLRQIAQERDRALIDLLWGSGCRIGEALMISAESVELWREEARLCAAMPVLGKGGKWRTIYVGDECADSLAHWLQIRPKDTDALLCSVRTGQPMTKNGIQSALKKLRKSAELPSNTIANAHSFRHAFAIRKLDEGYDLATVSQWLGHSDPAFTAKVYCVRSEAQLRRRYFTKP